MTETLHNKNLQDDKLEDQNGDDQNAWAFEDQESAFKPDISGYAGENAAVARCCKAYTTAFLSILAADPDDTIDAKVEGDEAYCRAMPPLLGAINIRDFIACTTHGMLTGVFEGANGTKLLYAAQVAHGTRLQKHRNKRAHSGPKSRENVPTQPYAQIAQTASEQKVTDQKTAKK